jgi:nucleotide-binding universal stress UspA family protein
VAVFKRIVVPLDGSGLAECALPHAVALAKALRADIVLIRVIQRQSQDEGGHPTDPVEWEAFRLETPAYLTGVASRLLKDGVNAQSVTLEGNPTEQIVDYVRAGPRTLLVMSSHGRGGITGWVLGGVAQTAALHAGVSFLLVRAYGAPEYVADGFGYRRILVPLDGSKRAECVIPVVATLCQGNGAEIILSSVVTNASRQYGLAAEDSRRALLSDLESEHRESIATYLEAIRDRLETDGLKVRARVDTADSPAAGIHAAARDEDVDLVVLAAHGSSCAVCWPFGAVPLNALVYGEAPLFVVQDLSPREIEPTQAERVAREVWGH